MNRVFKETADRQQTDAQEVRRAAIKANLDSEHQFEYMSAPTKTTARYVFARETFTNKTDALNYIAAHQRELKA